MTQDHIKHRHGAYASPRQPQGDFGRGKDKAELGSSDDVNRELNQRGAYRDAKSPQDSDTKVGTPDLERDTTDKVLTHSPQANPRPQRAEPLQPDNPSKGNDRLENEHDATQQEGRSIKKVFEQSQDALDNVRDGYD